MSKTRIIAISLIVILLAACNSEKREIERTAMGYIIETGNYRLEEAKQYASKETREVTLPVLIEHIMPNVDSSFLAANVPATATIDNITILNDTAWVDFTKTTPLGSNSNTLYLIKEDGKWLVDVVLNKADDNATPADTLTSAQ